MESLAKKIMSCVALSIFFGFLLCAPSRPPGKRPASHASHGLEQLNRFACNVTEDLVKSAPTRSSAAA